MKTILLMLVALVIGGALPLQGALNSHLGKALNHPLQASFVSFFGAVLFLVVLLAVVRAPLPSAAQLGGIPWYYYTGGVLGVVLVTAILVLTPVIGVANTLAAVIAGQLILSVILDHFGLLGLEVRAASPLRIVGCFGLIASAVLIHRG